MALLKKMEESTQWVNQMAVVVKKNGSLRIFLDPRNFEAIKRAHYPFPPIDEIAVNLSEAHFLC